MTFTSIPIQNEGNPLSADEFRDALAKGMGRAVRHVRLSSSDDVREILLDACIHCKTYDTQCEGARADWLFHLIELTSDQEFYRAKILEAIPASRATDSYDFWQLYYLVAEFAKRGDADCRKVLYREFDLMVDDDNIGGGSALVDLDGIPGLLHVLEIAGRRIRNGGDIWWEVSYLVEETEKKHGQENIQTAIDAEVARNEFVREYCEQKEQARTRNDFGVSIIDDRIADVLSQTTPPTDCVKRPVDEWIGDILADDFDDEKIRTATDDNIVERLRSRHPLFVSGRPSLADDEIETIWPVLIREENPYRLFCLLNAFTPSRRIRLPRFDPKILALIDLPYPFLAWKATQVLAQLSDESIRLKALELLRTVPAKPNWYDGVELILNSFQPEDEEAIAAALLTHHFPHDGYLHGAGLDIIHLAEKYPEVAFREPLLWFYERTPCSLCRSSVVEELAKRRLVTQEIWEECLEDCDGRLRELARRELNIEKDH